MIRGKYFITILVVLFVIRLLLHSQVVGPLFKKTCSSCTVGLFFNHGGDTAAYIDPWKNLLQKGIYSEDGLHPTAYRMPFTGLPFFLFYLLLGDEFLAYNIVGFLQILLGSIAVIYMANLTYDISLNISSNKKLAIYSALAYITLGALSLNNIHFDAKIMAEGPATNFLCFFIFYYYRYLSSNRKRSINFIWSSLFLALASLWRLYYLILYPIIILFEIYDSKRILRVSPWQLLGPLSRKSLILIMPILVLELPWIIRNYITFGRFIPFQSDIYAGTCDRVCLAYREFVRVAGDVAHIYSGPYHFSCYFENIDPTKCKFQFPFYMLGERLNIKEIEKAKQLYARYKENSSDPLLQDSVIHTFTKLSSYYRQDHPYLHWLYPRLVALRGFLFHSNTPYAPGFNDVSGQLSQSLIRTIKIVQALMYWIVLFLGTIGLFRLIKERKETYMLLLIPVYLILLFPIYLLTAHMKYFCSAYPILLVGASIQIAFILMKISLWKIPLLRSIFRSS